MNYCVLNNYKIYQIKAKYKNNCKKLHYKI